MSKIKPTHRLIEDVLSKVDHEGLDYAVLYYFGRRLNSEDACLNDLWATAYDALSDLDERLTDLAEK